MGPSPLTGTAAGATSRTMSTFRWPAEDGWPYPDTDEGIRDAAVPTGADDEDEELLLLAVRDDHLFGCLNEIERRVITESFGLRGAPLRSVHQLHDELGLPDSAIEGAMGSGLAKLRTQLLR